MYVKTVCPRDCPGRYPGCGAKCEKFRAHREKRKQEQDQRLWDIRINDVLYYGKRR